MSMMLTAKAMGLKVGNPIRKLVLLKLADQANDKGECWPSYKSIAKGAECSERAAMGHIDWLAKNGFLWIEKRHAANGRSMTNIYHLTLENNGESAAPKGESAAPKGESAAPYEGESAAPKPVNNQSYNQSYNQYSNAHAEACATKPAYKPKAKAAKKSDAMQADLAALENLGVESQTAKDWLVTRKEKRAGSLTQTVLTALQREASKAGLTVAQAVQVAAERNWARFVASYLQRESQGFAGAPSRPVNKINAVPKHTGGGVYLAKDVL